MSRKRLLAAAAATVFAAAAVLYTGLWLVAVRSSAPVELGYDADYIPAEQAQRIKSVQPGSPAERAGLRPGDLLAFIEGERLADPGFQERAWYRFHPGDTVHLGVIKPGSETPVALTGTFRRRESASRADGMTAYLAEQVRNAQPVPFIIVGLAVLAVRLTDPIAWLLALMFASIAATPGYPSSINGYSPALRGFARAYQGIFLALLGPLFYWFFSRFPARSPVDRRLPWLKWVALGLAPVFAVPGIETGSMRAPALVRARVGEYLADQLVVWWALALLVAGLVAFAATYLTTTEPEARRKVRVIFWGTLVGMLPNVVAAAARSVRQVNEPDWIATILTIVAMLIPVSLAYAVLKHRVLDVPVLLKRSARYLLVQRGFTLLLPIVSIGLTLALGGWLAPMAAPLVDLASTPGILVGALFGTMLLWGGTVLHRRVSERIDRAFFRRAYDARVILQQLAERTRGVTRREELASLLHQHVTDALQPSWLEVAFRDGERFAAFAGEARRDAECLVPMVGRDGEAIGRLSLGPRLSEEPYSREDGRLLGLVADQAALALDNLSLAEAIAARIEAEQRQAHEMAIAQEVQQKLFPQRQPRLSTLEYAGACTQARIVGGDYYDFLDLGAGSVGFLLADVSGKGIAAALLMANLQAMVRSQSSLAPSGLDTFLRGVNDRFYLSSSPNRFATMFIGRYDDGSRELTFVNCGHNPPLLLRRDGSVEWLTPTATALGFFDGWTGAIGSRTLCPGDRLVMYSDGITEAWSEADEEFGEERLLATVRAHADLAPGDLIARILADVRRFSPREQSDDWTLIAATAR